MAENYVNTDFPRLHHSNPKTYALAYALGLPLRPFGRRRLEIFNLKIARNKLFNGHTETVTPLTINVALLFQSSVSNSKVLTLSAVMGVPFLVQFVSVIV